MYIGGLPQNKFSAGNILPGAASLLQNHHMERRHTFQRFHQLFNSPCKPCTDLEIVDLNLVNSAVSSATRSSDALNSALNSYIIHSSVHIIRSVIEFRDIIITVFDIENILIVIVTMNNDYLW